MMMQENANPQKTLVFLVALMLIGAAITLATMMIWRKMNDNSTCTGGHINLQGRGMVVDSAVDNGIVRLTLQKKGNNSEIVMIDLCSGKQVGSLVIDTDAALISE